MKLSDTVDFKQVLAAHREWASDYYGGKGVSLSDERRANLRRANLGGADLSGADLSRAYLSGANLSRAYLSRADLSGATGFNADEHRAAFWIVPEVGAFVGWKKLQDGIVAKIEIPDKAKRTSSIQGRKCRAEYVKTLALYKDGKPFKGTAEGIHDGGKTKYAVGKITRCDKFDDSPLVECSNGIHFFITQQEAAAYN